MTYSLEFRKQVLKSLEKGMTFKEAVQEYDISPTTIQKWKKRLYSKKTRNIEPTKIANDALLKDVENHPDSYHYERARRLGCSTSGICVALKRLGITQKKDLKPSKSLSD
ncbi:IS630 transposase-related protein [Psychrobacter sp. I-STPA10]|uniref:IS630 transposase-related protein n=1 Tax=Psychrobacter sp. I-STPA10 TaxID=2585769 RepID=UPI001E368347|nr:IS630 transposase-related protein [Psychrobacter sp. I-STPA10]